MHTTVSTHRACKSVLIHTLYPRHAAVKVSQQLHFLLLQVVAAAGKQASWVVYGPAVLGCIAAAVRLC